MTTILVTGGAGFIGSHTSRALLDRGDSMVCIDSFDDYYSPARKHANVAPLLEYPGYTLIEGDIREQETTEPWMFGDGSFSCDYTYIGDIVQRVVAAIDRPLGYEIIHSGNNRTIFLRDFVALVQDLVGKQAKVVSYPMPPGDVPRTCADISKAQCLLDYAPQMPFEEGMARSVDWYRVEVAEK
jgi:nucleoside-diphosphate-sugar epimerase